MSATVYDIIFMPSVSKRKPVILITGTPGTGKTTTCDLLHIATGLNHIEVGKLVKEKSLHSGHDSTFDTYILDEDKVVDELEPEILKGGLIIDHHSCDFFPERWFDLVVVLKTNNCVLYPRLQKRGYSETKISENIECEIMNVCVDEAYDSYDSDIIMEMVSESVEDMERNVEDILEWIEKYNETQV